MVGCAVGDPCHLVGVHGYWSLAMLIQVVKAHLKGPNLQQRVDGRARALLLGQGTTFHQTYHCRLCAARQELGPRDSHFTQVGHLQERRCKHLLLDPYFTQHNVWQMWIWYTKIWHASFPKAANIKKKKKNWCNPLYTFNMMMMWTRNKTSKSM